jgi:hypothetical protein
MNAGRTSADDHASSTLLRPLGDPRFRLPVRRPMIGYTMLPMHTIAMVVRQVVQRQGKEV